MPFLNAIIFNFWYRRLGFQSTYRQSAQNYKKVYLVKFLNFY